MACNYLIYESAIKRITIIIHQITHIIVVYVFAYPRVLLNIFWDVGHFLISTKMYIEKECGWGDKS